jgi:hypothetical protein
LPAQPCARHQQECEGNETRYLGVTVRFQFTDSADERSVEDLRRLGSRSPRRKEARGLGAYAGDDRRPSYSATEPAANLDLNRYPQRFPQRYRRVFTAISTGPKVFGMVIYLTDIDRRMSANYRLHLVSQLTTRGPRVMRLSRRRKVA